jgi:hypothetical protein
MKIRSLAIAGLFALSVASVHALTLTETFSSDPAQNGWQRFGNTNLFQWNGSGTNLAVTWDSSQPNSYFYHPLGVTLTSASNFMFAVDFKLQDIAIGTDPGYPSVFQIAIGLLNFSEATSDGFIIGTGYQAPDLVEFDYFPAFDFYSASVSTPMISSANDFSSGGFTVPLELTPGARYHLVLTYTADNRTLRSILSSNGVPVGPLKAATLTDAFGGFNVDTLSINSYSGAGQDTNEYFGTVYAGSILAHGSVSRLFFATPLPVTTIITATPGSIQFASTTNWNYVLERSVDIQTWTDASSVVPGVEGALTLSDTNPPTGQAFYRVRADRP